MEGALNLILKWLVALMTFVPLLYQWARLLPNDPVLHVLDTGKEHCLAYRDAGDVEKDGNGFKLNQNSNVSLLSLVVIA